MGWKGSAENCRDIIEIRFELRLTKQYTWAKENNQDKAIKIILFLISPFFAFLYSLRTMRTRSSYVVFFLFSVFFGMAFSVPSGKTDVIDFDGAAYRERFENYKNVSQREFYEGFSEFLTFDEGKKDYYFDTLAYYINKFTHNYHVLFMVVAIIFAWFLLRTFRFFTAEQKLDYSIASLILTYLFVFKHIFSINGFRFWTAAWIGLYAIFQIFLKGNKRYWLLVFITPFFHGAYWIYIGVMVIAQFTRKFERIWVTLFIISFFVSNVAVELLAYSRAFLPEFVNRMVNSYTDADYMESRASYSGFGWVPHTFNILVSVYQSILIFLFIKNSKEIRSNKKTENLYLFLLVLATIFNFFSVVPSLGNRFIQFVWPLIAYIWLVSFKDIKYQKMLYFMPFVFTWIFFTDVSRYLKVLNLDFFVSGPFLLIYKYLIVS